MRLRPHFLSIIALTLAVFLRGYAVQAKQDIVEKGIASFPSLTVMADPSLSVPLTLIARDYALTHNISVSTIFDSTKTHIKEIEEGAEANVLIASKNAWVETLQQKGLIDVYSRTNIARNRLVLAGSEFEFRSIDIKNIKAIEDFTDHPSDFIFAIGNAAYTAEGTYAMEALSAHHMQSLLEPHYSFFRNMYQMMTAISRYQSMGVVFRTDALLFPNVKEITMFPADSHTPIIYQAVVVAGDNMAHGREFLTYLTSKKAARIFKSFGFDPA